MIRSFKINILFGLIISFFFVPVFAASEASAQPRCFITIEKSAPQDKTQEFNFIAEGGTPNEFSLFEGDDQEVSILINDSVAIVEEPIEGWGLANVTCDDDNGLEISNVPGGILATCVQPMQEVRRCTFNNIKTARPIPTISEWGVLATVALLGIAAVMVALRNRKSTA